jgi:hypothetical protein
MFYGSAVRNGVLEGILNVWTVSVAGIVSVFLLSL